MNRIVLSRAARRALVAWSRAVAPCEACGTLLGRVHVDGSAHHIEIEAVSALTNLAHDDEHFALDPGEIVRAERAARARGLDLVGFWHSHPRGEAVPSAADARGAWEGHACVLVGLHPRPRIRAWRWIGGAVFEDALAAPASCAGHPSAHNQPPAAVRPRDTP